MNEGLKCLLLITILSSALPCVFADEVQTFFCPFDHGQVEQKVLAMLDNAKSKIRMSCYALTDPAITNALISAKQRGVDVAILADKSQSTGHREAILLNQLATAGVPFIIGTSPVHHQLLHSKFIVADQQVEDGSWNFSGRTASAQSNTANFSTDPSRVAKFTAFWDQMKAAIIQQQKDY